MKVVAFNGSPRAQGNTAALLQRLLDRLGHEGIETELVQVGGHVVAGCNACRECFEKRDRCCVLTGDPVNEWIGRMLEADAIVLGSPTYFGGVTSQLKALIDRAGLVAKANREMLRRKVGAAVVAARRAGALNTFDEINHFFLTSQMIVPGSSYWTVGYGMEEGRVGEDSEAAQVVDTLGDTMLWLLRLIQARQVVSVI